MKQLDKYGSDVDHYSASKFYTVLCIIHFSFII